MNLSLIGLIFKYKPYLLVFFIPILAFFLRTYQLNDQALRGDEAATVLYSALPVTQLWEHSRLTDPHPPLYYLMLNPWQRLFGEDAWMMRFAGVAASTLAVAALYRLAQITLRHTASSILAAALLAINPLQIWLAQDIRSYPFFTLLGLLSSWALWQSLDDSHKPAGIKQNSNVLRPTYYALLSTQYSPRTKQPTIKYTAWILYILSTTICLYIHYYTVFLIAFQGLFVIINAKRFWSKRWPWLVSQVAIGLLIIPGLQLAYNFIGQAAGGIDTISTPDIFRLASTALLTGFTISDGWGIWVSLLLAPIWIIGVVTLVRQQYTSGTFWTLFFAVPILGVIALSIDRPFFKERFLIQAHPAFELLLAAGFLTLWNITTKSLKPSNLYVLRITHYALRTAAALLLALLLYVNFLALSNYFADPVYAKSPPWHLYHDYVQDKARPTDVMLTNFPEASVSYYSPNGLPFYVVPVERDRSVEFRLEETQKIASAYDRIWFLPLLRQGFDEQGDVLNWLDRHADRVNQVFFPDYNINLYLSPPTIEAQLIQQPTRFAHGLNLRGFQIFDEQGDSRLDIDDFSQGTPRLIIEPEDEFTVSLYWQANQTTDIPYTVFVHLIAADGFTRTSKDNKPVWGSYPTTIWTPGENVIDKYTLIVPAGTPSGEHQLRIGWYQSGTLERVPVLDAAGQAIVDHVILNLSILVE